MHSARSQWLLWTVLLMVGVLEAHAAAPAPASDRPISAIVEDQGKAVVLVANLGPRQPLQGTGSGFLVRPNGVFVTNYHVIARANVVTIRLIDGREFAVTGIIFARPDSDIAILKVDADGLPVVALGDSDAVKVGDRAIAIGSPLGLQNTVSDGIVSALRKHEPGVSVLQVTSPVSPGSSGGPLFNAQGEVVGITFEQMREGQNLNFAIPINQVKPLIRDTATKAFTAAAVRDADVATAGFTPGDEAGASDACPVIGNMVSRIYHVPGGQYYGQMHGSKSAVCFPSEEAAVQSGFRRSKR